ncbi:MAG: patatin-like phospholipase family protein [Polaribacter sp.]|uniref:patatin-like phospholipase family protein n=1 Tax=Polaribacter sp. TaxID=1920175 RepID=UPI003BAFE8C9
MKNKLLFLILIIPLFIFGQEKQPKVGLVLSGGGAKGFAHIGILKEIDSAGLQIDYIGGTSMGAIVGGLYAIGYSGLEIEKIVMDTDFMSLLRDRLSRNGSTFFEKEHGENTVVTLPVSRGRIGLPIAISKGQNVLNLLAELLAPIDNNADFSKLEIPFYCIATNVETGKEVILDNGFMPLALRASGSFPTLLNPVLLNDKLLVDGGVVNNFPVSHMKKKGLDVIIGVNVQSELHKREELNSAITILNQIIAYQIAEKTNLEKEGIDIYIHPEITDYTVMDFDDKKDIIKIGSQSAKEYTKVFEELAKKQLVKRERKPLKIIDNKVFIKEIDIIGSKNYTRAYVLGKLNIREADSLNRRDITKRIELLSATRNYERIDYRLIKLKDDKFKLQFYLIETKAAAELSLGVHYDLLYKSGVLANYQEKDLLTNNDLFNLDLILGDNLRYNLNYFVDNGFYWSYGFSSRYNHFTGNSKFNSTSDIPRVNTINLNYTDFTNQFFVQTTFNRKFALGIGAEHKGLTVSTETLSTLIDNETILDRSDYLNVFGYLKLDTYDHKYFVTKGLYADLSFKWYLTSSDYNNNFKPFAQAKGTIGIAETIAKRFTIQLTNEAGFTFENPTSNIFDFYLGGYNQNFINTFVSLYGYEFAELSDNSFLKTEIALRYRISKKHYASFIANYARLDDNVLKDLDLFKDVKSGYAIGYSYDSFLGPLELKYSWSPDTNRASWLFNLGFWF